MALESQEVLQYLGWRRLTEDSIEVAGYGEAITHAGQRLSTVVVTHAGVSNPLLCVL